MTHNGKTELVVRTDDGDCSKGDGLFERPGATQRHVEHHARVDYGQLHLATGYSMHSIGAAAGSEGGPPRVVGPFPQGHLHLLGIQAFHPHQLGHNLQYQA